MEALHAVGQPRTHSKGFPVHGKAVAISVSVKSVGSRTKIIAKPSSTVLSVKCKWQRCFLGDQ